MRLLKELDQKNRAEIGQELYGFAEELYPICRSITGDGIRRTLALIQNRIPLQTCEVPTGTPAFDWVILDSPPSLPVHDASSLADLCDGVLFVVRAGETSYEVAKKAASEFRDKNLIGVVMNQVDKSQGRGDYYYNAEKK